MRLEARTSLRQEQRLLPQMLQSIEVLQLATADLLQLVAQELQQNEALELQAPVAPDLATPGGAEAARAAPGREPGGDAHDGERPAARAPADAIDGKRAMLENQPAPGPSLVEFVGQQVAWLGLPQELGALVALLAQHLDERGLFPFDLDAFAAEHALDAQEVEDALAVLQTLEPRGIGARTAVEAMLLQAVGDPDFGTIRRLLCDHLDDLAKNRLPEVARAVQWSVEDLAALLDRMKELQPRPSASFVETAEPAIAPDVRVELAGDEPVVVPAGGAMPELAVSSVYEALLADRGTDRAVRGYLREKVRSARELIGAIEQRQATLVRVTAAVMRRQVAFLRHGRGALRPLAMAAVADELGLHASTVSRAIAGKWVETPIGTFRLRDFFDGARDGNAAAGVGRGAIAQRIADLVANEDRNNPRSDDELAAALAAQGIAVARRTVTKFRRELGIGPSHRRRRHGSQGRDA